MVGDSDELLGWGDADLEAAYGSGSLVAARRDGLGDLLDFLLLKDSFVEGLFDVFDVAVRGSAMASLRCLAFAAVRCPPLLAGGLSSVVRRGQGGPVGLTCLVGVGESPGGGDEIGLQLRDQFGVGRRVGSGGSRRRGSMSTRQPTTPRQLERW